jgi:hypothetical protein
MEAYVFVWSVFSYPVLVGLVFYYRRKKPHLAWLPVLSFAGAFMSALFHQRP